MNNKVLASLCCLLVSSTSWAGAMESCPQASQIQSINGIYTALTASGQDEWLGVIGHGKAGDVQSFESGLFYPAANFSGTQGTLAYCEYKTIDGVALNLRYRANEPEVRVSLARLENWQEGKSAFGQVFHECTNPAPGACAFTAD